MDITVEEILDYKRWVVDERNSKRIEEQTTDQGFYTDDYDMPLIKDVKYRIKTGYVADMANSITNQVIGDKPRCYITPKGDGDNAKKSADKAASVCNKWLQYWLRAYSNPYRYTFKDGMFVGGEGYIGMVHNEMLAKWLPSKHDGMSWQDVMPNALPIVPVFYPLLAMFTDPSTETNGQPSKLVISYKRTAGDVKYHYPNWKADYKNPTEEVDFFVYIDEKNVFAYAGTDIDGMALFTDKKGSLLNGTGVKKNLYGEVNFVHRYSGWGIENIGKAPDLMAFSRIRQLRSIIVEDSTMASDFSKNIHETAAPHRTLFLPGSGDFDEEAAFKGYKPEPDTISVVRLPDNVPKDYFEVEETLTYKAEAFAYAAQVRGRLNAKYPAPMQGVASGTSGRQEDLLTDAGMSIYDCAIDNNNTLWADALGLALRISANSKLDILPKELSLKDVNSCEQITVDLRKEDLAQSARELQQGIMLYKEGLIDHQKFLIEYKHETKEEAIKTRANAWIDNAMRTDPAFIQLITQTAAEEMGKEQQLMQIEEQMKGKGAGLNPVLNAGAEGGAPRQGNIRTERGAEMADQSTIHEARV